MQGIFVDDDVYKQYPKPTEYINKIQILLMKSYQFFANNARFCFCRL